MPSRKQMVQCMAFRCAWEEYEMRRARYGWNVTQLCPRCTSTRIRPISLSTGQWLDSRWTILRPKSWPRREGKTPADYRKEALSGSRHLKIVKGRNANAHAHTA